LRNSCEFLQKNGYFCSCNLAVGYDIWGPSAPRETRRFWALQLFAFQINLLRGLAVRAVSRGT
jgi:hypothetical protein